MRNEGKAYYVEGFNCTGVKEARVGPTVPSLSFIK